METRKSRRKRVASLFALIILIIISLIPLFFRELREGLQGIASTYGYFGLFIFAFIGGTSTLFPLPYPLAVITLAGFGFHPFLLGMTAGFGAALGDSISYFVGYRSYDVLHPDIQERLRKRRETLLEHPRLVMAGQFLYSTFSPFPDDVVLIPLGAARYPYIRAIIPVTIGKIIFNTAVALTGSALTRLFLDTM